MSDCVLITGVNRGLGKSLSFEFYRRGWELLLHTRDCEKARDIANELKTHNGFATFGDLRDKQTIEKLVHEAEKRKVSLLINNAGVYLKKPVAEVDENELREIMETNFFSAANLSRRMIPVFSTNGGGTIVNINSVAGKYGSYGESAYSASKHALNGFFDSMRYEVSGKGIKIINILLGGMQTDMTKSREDWNNLISPDEAARLIADSCARYDTLCPNEIKIGRIKY